jgi:hypothetical protein
MILKPPSKIALAGAATFVMLLIAIFARNFWVSLVLGALGAASFAYAAALVREYWRTLPKREKDSP